MGAPMTEKRVVRRDAAPVVNLELIPDHEIDITCRALVSTIKELFKDPAVQDDFARWKAERAARAAREEALQCCE